MLDFDFHILVLQRGSYERNVHADDRRPGLALDADERPRGERRHHEARSSFGARAAEFEIPCAARRAFTASSVGTSHLGSLIMACQRAAPAFWSSSVAEAGLTTRRRIRCFRSKNMRPTFEWMNTLTPPPLALGSRAERPGRGRRCPGGGRVR